VDTFLIGYQNNEYNSASKYSDDVLHIGHNYFLKWLRKYDVNVIYKRKQRATNKVKTSTVNSIVPIELKPRNDNITKTSSSNTITISLTGTPIVTIGENSNVEQIKNVLLAIKEAN